MKKEIKRYPKPMVGGKVQTAEPMGECFMVEGRMTKDYFECLLWLSEGDECIEVVEKGGDVIGFVWPHGEDYQAVGMDGHYAIWQTMDDAFSHVRSSELGYRMREAYMKEMAKHGIK